VPVRLAVGRDQRKSGWALSASALLRTPVIGPLCFGFAERLHRAWSHKHVRRQPTTATAAKLHWLTRTSVGSQKGPLSTLCLRQYCGPPRPSQSKQKPTAST
jgi:hypothetical protein